MKPLLIVLSVIALSGHAVAGGLALMVPAYFSPRAGGEWDRLAVAARRVPLVAIMNPSNGPGSGTTTDPDFARAAAAVRAAGGQVTGYVYTQYAKRPLAEVQADVQRYHDLYPLDGFFVDEMTNDSVAANVNYYVALTAFIKSLRASYQVTGNPGTKTVENYVSRPATDTVVTFEVDQGYATYVPDSWTRKYPAHRFCHLVYNLPTAAGMTNTLALARQRNAGFVYVTDDQGGNPWDRLPAYWDAEVEAIEAINRAATNGQPPKLNLQRSSPEGARLQLDGTAGRYVIELAPAFSAWQPVSTNLTTTGQLTFYGVSLASGSMRYFRARW